MLPGILAVPSSDWITIRPKLGAEAERALGVGGEAWLSHNPLGDLGMASPTSLSALSSSER